MRYTVVIAFVAMLLVVLAPGVQAQPVPFHEQEREWVNIAPDTLRDKTFEVVRTGYSRNERVIFAEADYFEPETQTWKGLLLKSIDDGASWERVFGWVNQIELWSQDARLVFALRDEQIFKSTDGGATWEDLTSNIVPEYIFGLDPERVAVSPFDSSRVIVADAGDVAYTLASEDGGRTWRAFEWGGGSHGSEHDLVASLREPGRVYLWAASEGSLTIDYFARTDDWGRSYQVVSYRKRPKLRIDDEGTLYSGSQPRDIIGRVSRDGGLSWQDMAYEADAVASTGALAATAEYDDGEGSFAVSYDRGRTWTELSDTLAVEGLEVQEIDERDSTIFAVSRSGLWAYARPGVFATSSERPAGAPEALELVSYPNPFRQQATVTYELPRPGHVSLVVYDVLGRRVQTLVDGRQAAGEHRVRFDAGGLSTGVYVCRLQTEDQALTHRLTLLR